MRSGIGPADTLKTVGIAVLNEQKPARSQSAEPPVAASRRRDPARNAAVAGAAHLRHRRRAALLRPQRRPAGDLFVSFIARPSGYANGNRLGLVGPSLYAPHLRGSVRLDPEEPEGRAAGRFQLPRRSRDAKRLLQAARFARALIEDAAVRAVTFEAFVLAAQSAVPTPEPTSLMLAEKCAAQILSERRSG